MNQAGGGIKTLYNGTLEYDAESEYFLLDVSIEEMIEARGVDLTVSVDGDTYTFNWVEDNEDWELTTPDYEGGIYFDEGFKLWFWNEDTQDAGTKYIGKTFNITYNEADKPKIETVTLVNEGAVHFDSVNRGEASRALFIVDTSGYNGEYCTVRINDEVRNDVAVNVDDVSVRVDVYDDAALAKSGEAYTVLVTYQKTSSGGGIIPEGSYYIDQNGTYDITEYAEVEVDVPSMQPSGTVTITQNGDNIPIAQFEYANVNVSASDAFTGTVTINIIGLSGGQPVPITYIDGNGVHTVNAYVGSPVIFNAPLTHYAGVNADQVHTLFKISWAIDDANMPFTITCAQNLNINAAVTKSPYASISNYTLVEIEGGPDIGNVSNVTITITFGGK